MPSLIRDRAVSTTAMIALFDDAALLSAALRFEAALATCQAELGLISVSAAEAIVIACQTAPDTTAIAEAAAHAGTLAIPLVADLRARLTDPEAARVVHLGATSQDVADTALMLQAKAAVALVTNEVAHLAEALAALTRAHAATPMLGRTLLQGALPITFGLKTAGWLTAIDDAHARVAREAEAALRLQLGGATGARHGLSGQGERLANLMAERLGLAPAAPWHARRDGVAGLAAALAILVGVVGKIATDVALLAQGEVGEAFEPRVEGRGGSSVMAHKRNPTGCQTAMTAAVRAPHLAAAVIAALPQAHERGLGGWQAESALLADLFQLTHGALAAMTPVIADLEVHPEVMARNLAAADVGDDLGEALQLVSEALIRHERTL